MSYAVRLLVLVAALLPAAASAQQYVVTQQPIVYTPIVGGQTVGAGIVGDDTSVLVNLGFSFSFFGQTFTQVAVSSNGQLSMGVTSTAYTNTNVPNTATPNNMIFAWWDDSDVNAAGDVTYVVNGVAPNREFVVQWANWTHLSGAQTRDMQVHLYEANGIIQVHYGANAGATDTASTGIEDATGNNGYAGLLCNPSCSAADWPTNQMIQYGVSVEPDLFPSVALGPMTETAGVLDFTVNTTMRNLGSSDATGSTWELWFSADRTLDPATDTLLGTHGNPETVPGQSAVVFTDPASTPRPAPGNWSVCVRADPLNTLVESNESNNSACSPPFLIGADLTGTVALPVQGAPGEEVPVTVHIQNLGSDGTGAFDFRIHFSADATLDASDPLLYTGAATLAGTDSYDAVEQVFIPANINGTQHYAILSIDSGGVVTEASELNNIVASPAQIELIKADLRLNEVTAQLNAGCFFGDLLTVSYEICNEGGGNAREFVIGTHLSANAVITGNDPEIHAIPQSCPNHDDAECTLLPGGFCGSDRFLGTCRFPCTADAECGSEGLACFDGFCSNVLTPGQCKTYTQTFPVPAEDGFGIPFAPAAYFIGIIADSTDRVNEQNEGNNIKRSVDSYLCRQPAPDVSPLELAPPAAMAAGEASPVFRTIRNLGNLRGAGTYRYFLSTNEIVSPDDLPIPLVDGPAGTFDLGAGEEMQGSDLLLLPASVPTGDYYLGVVVDPDGSIEELDETNNSLSAVTPIHVHEASLRVSTGALVDATRGHAYLRQLVATGGDGAYLWVGTALPPGLTLSEDGVLSGVPTETGIFTPRFEVTSGGATIGRILALRVNPSAGILAVATRSLPLATLDVAYSASLAAVGGVSPYTWSIVGGSLPPGLVLDGTALVGTPALEGDSTVTLRVMDSLGAHADASLSLRVVRSADLAIDSERWDEALSGEPYFDCVQARGGDGQYTWSVDETTLPSGMLFEQQGTKGCLIGSPTVCGARTVLVSVDDAGGQRAEADLPLSVVCDTIALESFEFGPLFPGSVVEGQLEARGAPQATFRLYAGSLPEGLALAASGLVSGTITEDVETGVYTFVVEAKDDDGRSGLGAFSILVQPTPREQEVVEENTTIDDGGCGGCAQGTGSAGSFALLGLGLLALLPRRRTPIARRSSLGLLAVALVALLPSVASAQAQGYTLRTRPAPYVPLVAPTPSGITGDDSASSVPLPFPVTFYGTPYNDVGVSTNGVVMFGGTTSIYSNTAIPTPGAPNNSLYVWWDDSTADAGDISYATIGVAPAREFVIQYADWTRLSGNGARNLQVRFRESSTTIEVHYGTNVSNNDSASAGIEDGGGTAASVQALACSPNCAAADWPTDTIVSYSQGPDLLVPRVTGDPVGYAGVVFHMEAEAANFGGADANGFGLRFFVSTNATLSADDRELGRGPGIANATPGQSALFALDAPLPADLGFGDYYILAEVDPDGAVAEDAENNNVGAYGPFPIGVPAPDLTVAEIRLPSTADAGGSFSLDWVAQNLGNAPATEVPYVVVLSENEIVTASDRELFRGTVSASALDATTPTVEVDVPTDVTAGRYYVGVVIDPEGLVYELDEINNLGLSADRIEISAGELQVATTSLPIAQLAAHYCVALEAVGGSGIYAFGLLDGATLPPGLALLEEPAQARAAGLPFGTLLCGTPSAAGRFSFGLEVTSAGHAASAELTLEVDDGLQQLEVVTRELPQGGFGQPYEGALLAMGGRAPYAWRLVQGSLPNGLRLAEDGSIRGAPRADGTFGFVAEVTDDTGVTALGTLALRVAAPARLTCATTALGPFAVGAPLAAALGAAGGEKPYVWETLETRRLASPGFDGEVIPDEAPPGFVLSGSGTVSGSASFAGRYLWHVRVTDRTEPNAQTATCTIAVEVALDQGITIVTQALPDAFPGEDYEARIEVTGANGLVQYSIEEGSELPEGLELLADGTIAGVLDAELLDGDEARTFAFLVRARDPQGRTGIGALALRLVVPPAEEPTEAPVTGTTDTGGCQSGPGGAGLLGLLLAAALLSRRRLGAVR